MNLQEFAKLKLDDKIANDMTRSSGVVVEVKEGGVRVRWGDGRPGNDVSFFYSVQATSWFHWTKIRECPNGGRCTSDRCETMDQCLGGTVEQYNNLAAKS